MNTTNHAFGAFLISAALYQADLSAQDFYFASARNSAPGETRYDLFRYDAGTGAQVLLHGAPGIDQHPVPINARLHFSRTALDGYEEVYSMTLAGTDTRRETFDGDQGDWHGNSHPFPIPGTNDFLVTTHRKSGGSVLRRVAWFGGTNVVFDPGPGLDAGHSPCTATSTYFASNHDGDFEIYRLDFATNALSKLTDNALFDSGVVIDPTGSFLVFTRADGVDPCSTNLWRMDLNGANQIQLTSDPGFQWPFEVNGNLIRYVSNENGQREIFQLNLSGTGKVQLVASGSDDVHLLPDVTCGLPTPELHLHGDPTGGPPGTTVTFEAEWDNWQFSNFTFDFGDGTSQTINTNTSPAVVTHTYWVAGNYRVSVEAADTCTPPNTAVAEIQPVMISTYGYEPLLGNALAMWDDQIQNVTLGFSFPFPGAGAPTPTTSIDIDSNGRIMLPGTDPSDYTESVAELLPLASICPFWDDINPASAYSDDVYFLTTPNVAVITWHDCVHYGDNQPFTVQLQLYPSGRIVMVYDSRIPQFEPLIGLSTGANNNYPGNMLLSQVPLASGVASDAVYHDSPWYWFDLQNTALEWTPHVNGEWQVRAAVLDFAEVEPLGVGCPSYLTYSATSGPALGTTFLTTLQGGTPSLPVLHAIGYSNPALSLGLGNCLVWTSAESITTGVANSLGASTAGLAIPNNAALLGLDLFFQGAAPYAPSVLGFGLTNGLRATIGY